MLHFSTEMQLHSVSSVEHLFQELQNLLAVIPNPLKENAKCATEH